MQADRQEQLLRDARDLHRWGYAQQLLRDMGGFANFAVSFTIISILTGAIVLFGFGLNYGGPVVVGFGWPLVTLFTLAVACSMAEIASAVPTAGAVYHWSALMGGPGWGWFTAWFNLAGQLATTAGIGYGIAQFVANLMGWEGVAPVLAVYGAVLLSQGLLNHYGIRTVALLSDFSVWYHLAVIVLLTGAFLALGRHQPLSFAFTATHNAEPGRFPYAWAFLAGLLQAQWTLTGYDASAHITEETVDPRRNAPWGMFIAVLLSGLCGYPMLLALTLAIQDLPAAAQASSAGGNSFVYLCRGVLGEGWGNAMVWAVLGAMWLCGLSSVTANARMIFAFARDRGLPGWARLSRVSARYRTPAPAVWFSVGMAFLIAVYALGYGIAASALEQTGAAAAGRVGAAFNAIVSISTIGLYVSYVLPVALVLRARVRGDWGPGVRDEPAGGGARHALGPWNLGAWGWLVNAAAVAWVAFISVLFVTPPNELSGYTFGIFLLVLAAVYLAAVRGRFQGPRQLGTEEQLQRLEEELDKTSVYR